jgi:mRNA interferase MazF
VKRGEVYLADLGEPVGHEQSMKRPVVIVSAQSWLETSPPVVTILPLTSTPRSGLTHVELEPAKTGLRQVSYIKCEDIRTISPLRLTRLYGHVDEIILMRVEVILRRLLALTGPIPVRLSPPP